MPSVQLPRTQALDSKTFSVPPVADGITFPDVFDWHFEHSRNHPFARYVISQGSIQTVLWSDVARAMHRAARLLTNVVSGAGLTTESDDKPIVISILAASDSLTYIATEVGVMRAGFTIFPISPRNSPDAIAHLLKATNTRLFLVGGEMKLQNLAETALARIDESDGRPVISMMPKYDDLYSVGEESAAFDRMEPVVYNRGAPAWIMHSSGSTSFPKPVYYTHELLIMKLWAPFFDQEDLCGLVTSCHGVPFYHGMGVYHLVIVAAIGIEMAVFRPAFPAIVPNPKNVLDEMKATSCARCMIAPSFLEAWSKDPSTFEFLKTMKSVMYGGGPLAKDVGDRLVATGIQVHTNYGCTECGTMTTIIPQISPGYDWDYLSISGHCDPQFVPQGDGTFEHVLMEYDTHRSAVMNTVIDGRKGYATSDLVVPHPTKPGLWKIYGRKDDQIMLSTGEKTNPGPLEDILSRDPRVRSAVMFGRGKFQNGVLIDPAPEFAFDPTDERKLEAFRNAIWPSIEKMNEFAPQHSRIFKEMIMVVSPTKPFTYTPKMNARKKPILKDYEQEIEQLYVTVEETSQIDATVPELWSADEIILFVRELVAKTVKNAVADDDNLFTHGCDSLQSVWIRNTIVRALRNTSPQAAKALLPNFVYDHPTINKMATHLAKLVHGSESEREMDLDERAKSLDKLLSTYIESLPMRVDRRTQPQERAPCEEVYFLTGSTGCIGSNILAHLLAAKHVAKVYAFNRPVDGTTSGERHISAFTKRGLELTLLDSGKLVMLEGDLSLTSFGLGDDVYATLHSSVTRIIHNAWKINLNLPFAPFEPLVVGARNLIAFALTSPVSIPPHLLFVSSIGVIKGINQPGPRLEVELTDPCPAASSGYASSKWLVERLLDCARIRGLRDAAFARLGQICGDSRGNWTESEYFPALVQSCATTGCLPELSGDVSWLLASDAAAALIALSHSTLGGAFHVVNPRRASSALIVTQISRMMQTRLVPYTDWLKAIELADPATTPATRLISFFRTYPQRTGEGWEPIGIPTLACDRTVAAVPTLLQATVPGEAEVERWLARWDESGFINIPM